MLGLAGQSTVINATTVGGDNTVIAAVPGRKIRVLSIGLTLKGGTAGSQYDVLVYRGPSSNANKLAQYSLSPGGGINRIGLNKVMETNVNEPLVIVVPSSVTAVTGDVEYQLVS